MTVAKDIIKTLSVFNIDNTNVCQQGNHVEVFINGAVNKYGLFFDISQQTIGIKIKDDNNFVSYFGFDIDNLKPIMMEIVRLECIKDNDMSDLPFYHPLAKSSNLKPLEEEETKVFQKENNGQEESTQKKD